VKLLAARRDISRTAQLAFHEGVEASRMAAEAAFRLEQNDLSEQKLHVLRRRQGGDERHVSPGKALL
jgi:hypothetical protein